MLHRLTKALTALCLVALCAAGCSAPSPVAGTKVAPVAANPAAPVFTFAPTATPTPTMTPVPTPTPEPRSATSGEWLTDVPNPTYQPVMISIENAEGCRPQIGLNQADIIYEFPVEYSVTRFQAIFNDEYPPFAGPVRSSRYYFMRLQQEWNTMYVHRGYGGLPYSRKWVGIHVEPWLMDTGDMFWNLPGRKKVHSLMVNVGDVVGTWYPGNIAVPYERWRFSDEPDTSSGKAFTSVALNFFYRRTKEKNWITFNYMPETNTLNRYQDGRIFRTLRVTAQEGRPARTAKREREDFFCQNLVVQYTSWSTLDDEKGHRVTELNGEGKCDYFINGKHLTGYWSRLSYADKTQYYLDSGDKLVLAPGRTWICVHPDDFALSPVVIHYADGTTGEPATSKHRAKPAVEDGDEIAPEDMMLADE